MEVLNAAALAGVLPPGVFRATSNAEIKNGPKIKSFFKKPTPTVSHRPPSFTNYAENLFKTFGSHLKIPPINSNPTILLSSLFGAAPSARALTYEEALQQSMSSSPEAPVDFDVNNFTDSVLSFTSENALAIAAGVVLVGIPVALTRIFSTPTTWGTASAVDAYSKLREDPEAQLVDIRSSEDIKEVGSPDIRKLKKRTVQIAYGDDASFLQNVSQKFKDPANTTLYILDKFDGNSAKVAKLLGDNGFKFAYAIKDGAEGRRGWQNSGLPWVTPKKAFSLDFGNLADALSSAVEDTSELFPVTVGVAAATGVGLVAFSEIETVLQLLGSAALLQIFVKKILFAEDRKRTIQQIQEFLDTNVAPQELLDELKVIGKAFLPKTVDGVSNNGAAVPQSQKVDGAVAVAVSSEDMKQQTSGSTTVTVSSSTEVGGNSVPQSTPVKSAMAISGAKPQYLSPYPHYPDFKPPTSPMPSRP